MPFVILAIVALYLFTGDHLKEVESFFQSHGTGPDTTPAAGPTLQQAPPKAPYAPPSQGAWQQTVAGVENAVQAKTGVPVAAIGNAAVRAPTWSKVVFPPIAATSFVQKAVTHPVAEAKAIGSTVAKGAKAVGSGVEHAASGAYHAISSWL